MHKSLILLSALIAANIAAYGGLTVSTQKKSLVPSDKNIVVGIEGVDSVNDAINEISAISRQCASLGSNVYTKAQCDAKFQPVGNYLVLDEDGMVPGEKVKMGTDSWSEPTDPTDNSNGMAYIYFTAKGIGAYDGVYLTSISFKTRTSYSVTQQSLCLGISEATNRLQLAYTDLVPISAINTFYTFTLVKPLLLDGSKTYRILFRNSQEAEVLNVTTELALCVNSSADPESYVGTLYVDSEVNKTRRAVLKSTWYTPATLRAMKGLIESKTSN